MADSFAIRLAFQGEFQTWQREKGEAFLKGIRDGAEDVADFGKKKLRDALVDSGLKLNPKTWQADIYPKSGLAWEPAVFLHTKAPKIIAAFDEGGEIRAKDGYMAVPLPYYQDLLPRQRGRYSKSKIELTYEKYGAENLIVLPKTADRPAILALETGTITKRGAISARKRTKTGKRRKNTALIPLFFLVESVDLKQRLDIEKTFAEIEREAPGIIQRALTRRLSFEERGGWQ